MPERQKTLLRAMLTKNRFGDELWLATESLQIIIGRVSYRRKREEFDTKGRRLSDCESAARKTVQRWIDEAVGKDERHPRCEVCEDRHDGILCQVIPENSWVREGASSKFRRSATYRLNPHKLKSKKTYEQWKAEKIAEKFRPQRASHRSPVPAEPPRAAQEPSNVPSVTVPAPVAVAESSHRATGRSLTTRQRRELQSRIQTYRDGRLFIVDEFGNKTSIPPGHRQFIRPMEPGFAVLAACKSMAQGDPARELAGDGVSMQKALEAAREMGYDAPPGGGGP